MSQADRPVFTDEMRALLVRCTDTTDLSDPFDAAVVTLMRSHDALGARIGEALHALRTMADAIDHHGIDSQELPGEPEVGIAPYKWHEEWRYNAQGVIERLAALSPQPPTDETHRDA